MDTIVLAVYVVVCVGLVGLILIQQGKGADAGANFGGGSAGGASDSVFGSQGSSNFLSKSTAILATTFFCIALFLSYSSGQKIKEKKGTLDLPAIGQSEQQKSEEADIPSLPTPAELSVPVDSPADSSKTSDTPDLPGTKTE